MHSNAMAQVRAFGAITALVVFAVAPAGADDVGDELKQMRELVLQLQDQVNNQQSQIEGQSDVIREAGLEDRSSSSKLSSFLESTDFGGTIAASYNYNFNNPHSNAAGPIGGNNAVSNPFHPNHNMVQLDEVWLSASRSGSDESPVGFGIDLVYGQAGDLFHGNVNGNGVWLNQGYLDYTAHGMTLTAGKFATHIGYEVAGAANNVMITRGFTYQLLQPVSQIGAKVGGEMGGIGWMFGVTNGFAPNQPDGNGNKDIIWQLGWSNDTLTALFNGEWGRRPGTGDRSKLILDGVVEFAPTDAIVTWFNVTYLDNHVELEPAVPGDNSGIGINVGGRLGLGDRAGIGSRFEWGEFDSGYAGIPGTPAETELWSITGTFDYLLAEGLTIKAELQYTKAVKDGVGVSNSIFPDGSSTVPFLTDDQLLGVVQLVYAF